MKKKENLQCFIKCNIWVVITLAFNCRKLTFLLLFIVIKIIYLERLTTTEDQALVSANVLVCMMGLCVLSNMPVGIRITFI